jgi:hypothetical protein
MMPMNKKTFMAAIIAGLLFFLITTQVVEVSEAQPLQYPGIELLIENDSSYNSNSIPLFFSGIPIQWANVTYSNFTCYLDGNEIALNSSDNTLTGLSNGQHTIIITASVSARLSGSQLTEFYAKYGFSEAIHAMEALRDMKSVDTGLIGFNVEVPGQLTPTPTTAISPLPFTPPPTIAPPSSPNSSLTFTASLAESASSLYFGNTINFTVTAQGGKEPYTYSWNVDNQTVETSTSPYYSANNLAIGEHHVFVTVTDADSNTANTLIVAFNSLPNSNSSPTPSPSVPEFSPWVVLPMLATLAAASGSLFKRKPRHSNNLNRRRNTNERSQT